MNYLDRYLWKIKNVDMKYLQLVGIAALFIANKHEEISPRMIETFVIKDTYSKDDIREMEKSIINELGYFLNPVTLDEELLT